MSHSRRTRPAAVSQRTTRVLSGYLVLLAIFWNSPARFAEVLTTSPVTGSVTSGTATGRNSAGSGAGARFQGHRPPSFGSVILPGCGGSTGSGFGSATGVALATGSGGGGGGGF